MNIGDRVTRQPVTFFEREDGERQRNTRPMTGTVVYIHPYGRYHTVEFKLAGGSVLESFQETE